MPFEFKPVATHSNSNISQFNKLNSTSKISFNPPSFTFSTPNNNKVAATSDGTPHFQFATKAFNCFGQNNTNAQTEPKISLVANKSNSSTFSFAQSKHSGSCPDLGNFGMTSSSSDKLFSFGVPNMKLNQAVSVTSVNAPQFVFSPPKSLSNNLDVTGTFTFTLPQTFTFSQPGTSMPIFSFSANSNCQTSEKRSEFITRRKSYAQDKRCDEGNGDSTDYFSADNSEDSD